MDVYCIHLPHRTDRRAHMDKIALRYPSIKIHYVNGVYNTDGVIGCNLSHKKVIREAKTRGDPYVLVLEDDCDILVPDERLSVYLHTIDEFIRTHSDIEIINGCGNLPSFTVTSKIPFHDMFFLTSNQVFTTHFIVYCASSYDKILESPTNKPIDVITNELNMVFTYPYLATQLESYSDIQNTNVSYANIVKSQEFIKNLVETSGKTYLYDNVYNV